MIERVHVRARVTPCTPAPRSPRHPARRRVSSRWHHGAVMLPVLRMCMGTSQRIRIICAILSILVYGKHGGWMSGDGLAALMCMLGAIDGW